MKLCTLVVEKFRPEIMFSSTEGGGWRRGHKHYITGEGIGVLQRAALCIHCTLCTLCILHSAHSEHCTLWKLYNALYVRCTIYFANFFWASIRTRWEIQTLPFEGFSKHWPSGPMLSIIRNVHMCVCLCVCSLLRYRLTVFLPPLPDRAVTCSRNSGVLPNSEFFRK